MDYYNTADYGNLGSYGSYNSYGTGLAIGGIIYLIISLAVSIFLIVGLWKLFKKCGKGGWEAIVPIYNFYILVEIAGLNWWWFLAYVSVFLIVIPGVAFVAPIAMLLTNICVLYNLSKKFHKGTGWFVASIFFSGILLPVLGYSSKDVYDVNEPVSKNGFFGNGSDSTNPTSNAPTQSQPLNDTTAPGANAAASPVTPVITPVAETPPEPAPVVPEAPEVTPGPDAADVAPVDTEATQPLQTETTSPIGLSEVNSDVVNVPTDENK